MSTHRKLLQSTSGAKKARALVIGAALVLASSSAKALDFNREVRPILAAHCFACHGPDEEGRKGNLRLDRPSADDRQRIGSASSSTVLDRISSHDPEEIMPPPGTKNPLTKAQHDTLHEWINEGAIYAAHWAFEPPTTPTVPLASPQQLRASHPLDSFVFARQDAHSLTLSSTADPHTLVRRYYLDLIGLPPTPNEAAAYVTDQSLDPAGRLIDRLLASPAYGERWARPWLDLARYADTNGYEKDRPRSIWPYRDWVIDALNADLPYDTFTIDQLAGDLQFKATPAQRIATGFHRNTMLNEEGGIDPLEYQFHSLVDRVGTTSTVWLGLTMACAQCHTHKFDPLYHHDYYSMMAFFNNAEEPEWIVPDDNNDSRRAELESQIAILEADLPNRFSDPSVFQDHFQTWLQKTRKTLVPWEPLTPKDIQANLARLSLLDDNSILARGDQTKRDTYTIRYEGHWEGVRALRLEALPHPSLPKSGPGRAYYEGPKGDFFLSELKVRYNGTPIILTNPSESYAKLGIGGGNAQAATTIDGNEVTGWSTFGREGEPHQAVYHFPQTLNGEGHLEIELIFNRHYSAALGRFRFAVSKAERPAKAQPFAAEDEILFHRETLTPDERQRLVRLFCAQAAELAQARQEIGDLRKLLPDHTTTLVFEERPIKDTRPTFRHHRGEYLQPKEPVSPAVPAIFSDLPENAPRNRLGFAQWLVSDRNPLAARVQVNRDWAAIFGRGIVRTTEDFGYQGESPSHPQLLDWLAVDFAAHGWSRKRLHRTLVNTATYRQRSEVTADLLDKDPENLWLARSPRFRIDGELIRDTSLQVASLLTRKLRGPSVYPPQPLSVTTEGTYGGLPWTVSPGEDRYRRGLYTFAKRTAPYAMFTTFDAGSGEACLARREMTNTPLQALTALNDPAMLEAAQSLGVEMAGLKSDDPTTVTQLFQRILTRPPTTEEHQALMTFITQQKARFAQAPEQARQLLESYHSSNSAEPATAAAWSALARVLLNLDETFLHQ